MPTATTSTTTTTPGATMDRGGRARHRRLRDVAVVALLLSGLAACGSDSEGGNTDRTAVSTNAPIATATTPDAAEPNTTAADTIPDTTDSTVPDAVAETTPATQASTTTVTTITTVVDAFPRGWQPIESFPDGVYAPREESNWIGVPSPALPASPGQPLADGVYPIDAEWDPSNPTSLAVEVQRLEPCSEAPEFACISFEGPFQPDEVGVDDTTSYPMTVPLDGSIGVGLVGYDCVGAAGQGNGADLASLFIAWDGAYHRTIAPQIEAGADEFTTMEAIAAEPTDGFAGANTACPDFGFGGLIFRTGSAPPVLHQIISRLDDDNQRQLLTVTDLVVPDTVQVVNGKMTFYWYAGFLS